MIIAPTSEGGGSTSADVGRALMIEGILAIDSAEAQDRALALTKTWLAMVKGPDHLVQPLGGGVNEANSADSSSTWPYGVSVVKSETLVPAGVPAWRFPIVTSSVADASTSEGSSAGADEDAVLGMVYLARALGFPSDFVDLVIRSIIAFASADLGYPDLYRALSDGTKVFVPKLGSMRGGLTPEEGKFRTSWAPWCYSPGSFAPAHYRSFRDFAKANWQEDFDTYLPKHMDGTASSLEELLEALDSAVLAGYNILRHASCETGAVSDIVGVEAACEDDGGNNQGLHCAGVPWKYTPEVGEEKAQCELDGMTMGSFGASGSQAVWRVAMDYILFPEESTRIKMYDRAGDVDDAAASFNAPIFLARVARQYMDKSTCDGGTMGACQARAKVLSQPLEVFAAAYEAKDVGATCANVPHAPQALPPQFLYPTFTAFVAPHDRVPASELKVWMDSVASCGIPLLPPTSTTHPEFVEALTATLLMSGQVPRLHYFEEQENSSAPIGEEASSLLITKEVSGHRVAAPVEAKSPFRIVGVAIVLAFGALVVRSLLRRRRKRSSDLELLVAWEDGME